MGLAGRLFQVARQRREGLGPRARELHALVPLQMIGTGEGEEDGSGHMAQADLDRCAAGALS